MQFGGGEPGKGLTRENEPEEFFSTNMDDMSDAEKIKSKIQLLFYFLKIASSCQWKEMIPLMMHA